MRLRINRPLLLALALGLAALFFLLPACAEDGETAESEVEGNTAASVKAVVTIPLISDLVEQVGGERVEVLSLLPSGADAHTYEPVPKDVQKLEDADVVFTNGLGLEVPAIRIIDANLPSETPLVQLAEEAVEAGAALIDGDEHEDEGEEHEHEEGNPHLWLDAQNAMSYVESIRDALVDVDPDGAETYRSNAETYLAELRALDEEVAAAVDSIPAAMRKLVTFHDAYPYMARRYGLEVVAVVVPSPGQEPSAKDVQKLVDSIREQDVPAVFKEPQFNARILELAADDAGVEVCTLYSGSLDDKVTDYVDLMRFNAGELVRCLG